MNIRIKQLRIDNDLTLKDMAKLLGLKTASAYYKKENGSTPFSLVEAKILAQHFKKSIEEIFFDDKLS